MKTPQRKRARRDPFKQQVADCEKEINSTNTKLLRLVGEFSELRQQVQSLETQVQAWKDACGLEQPHNLKKLCDGVQSLERERDEAAAKAYRNVAAWLVKQGCPAWAERWQAIANTSGGEHQQGGNDAKEK